MDSIDINEKELYDSYPDILDMLLYDNTTKKNIIWGTDTYKKNGYYFNDYITPQSIIYSNIIKPRSEKAKDEKLKRARDNGEVFTPSWMCNKQNNITDNEWFGRKDVFNYENTDLTWKTNLEKIVFSENKSWKDYVKDIRLEMTCGEAPYLVSRYDTVTGMPISLIDRIGILDRKLRVVNENSTSDEEWLEYALEALKATYGFEWQGDNLLLARENLLFTFIDNYKYKFGIQPSEQILKNVVTVISWNIWQMDGLKGVIPGSCKNEKISQINLFSEEIIIDCMCSGCQKNDIYNHNGVYAKIMDWHKNKKTRFVDLIRRK